MSCNWLVSSISPAQPSTRLRLGVGPVINYTIQFDNTLTICQGDGGAGARCCVCGVHFIIYTKTQRRGQSFTFLDNRELSC